MAGQRAWIGSVVVLAASSAVFAGQEDVAEVLAGAPILDVVRVDQPPVIDGVLDEQVWIDAPMIDDFRQTDPIEGGEPSQRTEVRVLVDAGHIYIGVRCLDTDPDAIIATQMKRDAPLGADDHIAIIIDPYFAQRNGFYFQMNALGARGDSMIEDNTRLRSDWDCIWHGMASIDDQGWVVEVAIPFKSLSFNPNTTRWGFNVARSIRRNNEIVRWASPRRDTSLISLADVGVIEGLTDLEQGLAIDVKPFMLGRIKRNHDEDTNGTDFDAGLDVFYHFTPELTLALTVNTDFAETEVDERRVNLSRFPLFFPEKRDFFLQDAGIFNFGGINRNPLPFFSRRIGLGSDGEPRSILGGVKLTGRAGPWNLGFLDVQVQDEGSSENLFVGRASLNIFEQSTIGAIVTHGDPQSPDRNSVGGLDFNYRTTEFADDKTLEAHAWFLLSDTSDVEGPKGAWGAKMSYPNDRIDWGFGFTEIDDQFDAALGFVPRRGIREYFADWRYRFRPESDWIRSIDAGGRLFLYTNLDDDVESRSLRWELMDLETEAGDEFRISVKNEREVLTEGFEISDGIIIPSGDYRFNRYDISLQSSSGRPVNLELGYEGGEFYEGTRDEYTIGGTWRVSPYFNIGGDFQLNDVDLPEGDFITRVIRSRINVQFSPDLTWSTFGQYDNQSESIGVNSRLRWTVKPGNDIYIVLNQAVLRDETSFRVQRTELTSKIGWTWRF